MSKIDLTQFDGHTPGPWHECDHHGRRWIETSRDGGVAQIVRTGIRSETVANSALIKAAPELLAEVRRLTAEAEAVRRERDEARAELELARNSGDIARTAARSVCAAVRRIRNGRKDALAAKGE